MQCYRLVGKDRFSAWIGTVGAVSIAYGCWLYDHQTVVFSG